MSERKKDSSRASPPQGAFSTQRGESRPPVKSDAPKLPSGLGVSLFPPNTGPPPGSEEVVLDDIAKNAPMRPPTSSFPPPLGQSEGHDAWTTERMSRQSTVPPVRKEEVDRLREMAVRSRACAPSQSRATVTVTRSTWSIARGLRNSSTRSAKWRSSTRSMI